MNTANLVSCIIPVFNGEKYLSEALDSLFDQTYEPLEIIIIDDGSTDTTPDILAAFEGGIRSLRQENAGPAAARNRGIEAANGAFICFLDSDDLYAPDKIERQVACLSSRPGVGVCTVLMKNFWIEEMGEQAAAAAETPLAEPQAGPTQTMMVRAEVFDSVGLFNPDLTHRDSADWLLRAREADVAFFEIDEVLVHRRIHDSNMSLNRGKDDAEDLFAIIQQRLARESAS